MQRVGAAQPMGVHHSHSCTSNGEPTGTSDAGHNVFYDKNPKTGTQGHGRTIQPCHLAEKPFRTWSTAEIPWGWQQCHFPGPSSCPLCLGFAPDLSCWHIISPHYRQILARRHGSRCPTWCVLAQRGRSASPGGATMSLLCS